MSVVVGHTITGYAVAELQPANPFNAWWKTAAFVAVVANLPDLDLLVGLLVDRPLDFHHGPTHSLAAALAFGAIAGLLATLLKRRFWSFFWLSAAVYASHVLLDAVAPERSGPHSGVALFWPVTGQRLSLPVPMPDWLFQALALEGGESGQGFLSALVGWDTVLVMGAEAVLFAPLLGVAILIRRSRTA